VEYRAEASTLEGFVQQLAVCYVARGYWFYVSGVVPPHKDPRRLDAKLIERYRITSSKFERSRRKASGLANVQYIRFGDHFFLLATAGEHRFFREEPGILDCREVPLKFGGYAIGYRGEHAQVRIERGAWKWLRSYYLDLATKRSVGWFATEFRRWPYEPYAPIRQQTFIILNQVNRARKAAGLELVPTSCVRIKRRIYRPFEEPLVVGAAAVGVGLAE
jgi:hypothetical protein